MEMIEQYGPEGAMQMQQQMQMQQMQMQQQEQATQEMPVEQQG